MSSIYNGTYIRNVSGVNKKKHKFRIGDHLQILKYKNVFEKVYFLNWNEKVFVLKK